MDIKTIFQQRKKNDLNDDFKEQGEDDPKKARRSSAVSYVVDEGDVFSGGLDDSSYRDILHNCLKNLQTEVRDLAGLARNS